MPAPIAENWEQAVAYIDAIELSAEEAYGLYEEKLPENIIDSPVRPNTHPKVNGIKIVVGRKPPYFGSKPVIAIVIDDMGNQSSPHCQDQQPALSPDFVFSDLRNGVAAADSNG